MTLENIAACCSGTYIGEDITKQTEVTDIVIDSRKVSEGCLFIPIRGERVDGHSFIPEVFKAGALACLSEVELENADGPYILVKSTPKALQQIAAFYRQSLDIKVVGITGSVGKTSTKEMIASVLEEKYCIHKTAGNFNNEIGLPLTVFGLQNEHEVAVLEMGISDFGEMERLAKIANPDVCVITNIGLCHLENLVDRDGILKAKTEVFAHMKEDGCAVLNGDDDKLATVTEVCGKSPVFYGKEKGDVYATDIEILGIEGIRMQIHVYGEKAEVTVPIPGEHNVYNALAAACVGKALGMQLEEICRGIENVETISGRNNLISVNDITIIDDCYNANPVSMKASIGILSYAKGRKIAVLGDMGELGKKEKELHYGVGEYFKDKGIDMLFCAGTLSAEIAKGAQKDHSCQIKHFMTRDALIEALLQEVKKGDTLLVKASHFMEFSKVVEALKNRSV